MTLTPAMLYANLGSEIWHATANWPSPATIRTPDACRNHCRNITWPRMSCVG
jgi:hypothetical protein